MVRQLLSRKLNNPEPLSRGALGAIQNLYSETPNKLHRIKALRKVCLSFGGWDKFSSAKGIIRLSYGEAATRSSKPRATNVSA